MTHIRGSPDSPAGDTYHGFISYCSRNLELVRDLVYALQKKGLRIWWDRDTGEHDLAWRAPDDERGKPLGTSEQDIRDKLEKFLSTSTLVIVVATKAARSSSWVQIEFAHAFDRGSPLIIWHADGDFYDVSAGDIPPKRLTPLQRTAFAGEQTFENILSHISNDRRSVRAVADAIHEFMSLAEFIEWRGDSIGNAAVDRHEVEHDRLWRENKEMREEIWRKFGRALEITRTPHGQVMPNRRVTRATPWIVRTHRHLKRILEDEEYRHKVFQALDEAGVHGT